MRWANSVSFSVQASRFQEETLNCPIKRRCSTRIRWESNVATYCGEPIKQPLVGEEECDAECASAKWWKVAGRSATTVLNWTNAKPRGGRTEERKVIVFPANFRLDWSTSASANDMPVIWACNNATIRKRGRRSVWNRETTSAVSAFGKSICSNRP